MLPIKPPHSFTKTRAWRIFKLFFWSTAATLEIWTILNYGSWEEIPSVAVFTTALYFAIRWGTAYIVGRPDHDQMTPSIAPAKHIAQLEKNHPPKKKTHKFNNFLITSSIILILVNLNASYQLSKLGASGDEKLLTAIFTGVFVLVPALIYRIVVSVKKS